MTFSTIAYLGLGSNLGDRPATLKAVGRMLAALPGITIDPHQDVAALYESKAVGGPVGQPDYLNTVLRVRTTLAPVDLLRACLGIESELGRVRQERWGPRTMDIDLLLFGDRVLNDAELVVPHPRMPGRPFVLVPLRELAPDLVHPTLAATIAQLAERLEAHDVTHRVMGPEWFRASVAGPVDHVQQ